MAFNKKILFGEDILFLLDEVAKKLLSNDEMYSLISALLDHGVDLFSYILAGLVGQELWLCVRYTA